VPANSPIVSPGPVLASAEELLFGVVELLLVVPVALLLVLVEEGLGVLVVGEVDFDLFDGVFAGVEEDLLFDDFEPDEAGALLVLVWFLPAPFEQLLVVRQVCEALSAVLIW
jgi:hypothetical protein